MDAKFVQQMAVFAAIFLLCQVGFDWIQGRAVSMRSFGGMLIVTGIVTAVYAGFVTLMNKRRNRD